MITKPARSRKSFFALHPALGALILGPLFAGLVWYMSAKPDVLLISLAVMAGCALVAVASAEVRLSESAGWLDGVARVLWDGAWFSAVLGVLLIPTVSVWLCLLLGFLFAASIWVFDGLSQDGGPVPLRLVLLPAVATALGTALVLLGVSDHWAVWAVFIVLCLPQESLPPLSEISVQRWLWAGVLAAATLTAGSQLVMAG